MATDDIVRTNTELVSATHEIERINRLALKVDMESM